EFGLDCKKCGACSIADFRALAEEMGYKVLVAEGSPIVLKIIVSGYVDAIVGVACLNVLEKAIDKILLAGIPCMAIPLLSSDSRPFITLAVYDALTGGKGTTGDGAEHVAAFTDSVRRAAMSIEAFHKASLVHDDIEDDDAFRYGEDTVHKQYGTATAINVGDY